MNNMPDKQLTAASRHLFAFSLKKVDRQTTKEQWRLLSSYLRIVRNKVESRIDSQQIKTMISDLMITGTGFYQCQA